MKECHTTYTWCSFPKMLHKAPWRWKISHSSSYCVSSGRIYKTVGGPPHQLQTGAGSPHNKCPSVRSVHPVWGYVSRTASSIMEVRRAATAQLIAVLPTVCYPAYCSIPPAEKRKRCERGRHTSSTIKSLCKATYEKLYLQPRYWADLFSQVPSKIS